MTTCEIHELTGTVLRPGDPGFDTAVTGFQTAHPHRPDLVVAARSADDVARAVRYAARRGLPVAAQSTGHGRAEPLPGGVLVDTGRVRGVVVDPAARTARIQAGARWADVAAAAAPHGLTPLSGSSPTVGVVGYLRGGGFAVLARTYGYAADRVRTVRAVDPAGTPVRTTGFTPGHLVTEVEVELLGLARVWGGSLSFPATPDVLAGYAHWTSGLPEELTSSIALVPFPDLPGVPAPFRGRHVAVVRVAAPDSAAGVAEALTAPLRELGEVLTERLGSLPAERAHTVYSDPTEPHAYAGDARLLRDLDPRALRGIPALTGPDSATPSVVELRHLGGALARPGSGGPGPVDAAHRGAGYLLRAITMTGPVTEAAARAGHRALFAPFAGRELGRAGTFAYGLTR